MKNPFTPILARQRAVLFDGALATELERRGANLSSHLWSAKLIADEPERIIDVHLSHLRAGADVISSASYQASRLGFAKVGISSADADARLTKAVVLAHDAVRRHTTRALVAASLGPYGAVLADGSEFTGDYPMTVQQLIEFHRPRVAAALKGVPDLILFETLPSMAECEAVAALAAEFSQVPFMASFSAKAGTISHGESFASAVTMLEEAPNVIAVGLNCTSPELIEPILRTVTPKRVLLAASPNAGETWDAKSRTWVGTPLRGTEFAVFVHAYLRAGAKVVGGCCRTRPGDIAAARVVIER